jgi:hypothetical protein
MAIYVQKATILKRGVPFIFDITHVYYNVVYGHFFNLEKIPALFEASNLIDGTGKLSSIYENDLRWYHYETADKMMIFHHFRLPHYVKRGDKLLYLE